MIIGQAGNRPALLLAAARHAAATTEDGWVGKIPLHVTWTTRLVAVSSIRLINSRPASCCCWSLSLVGDADDGGIDEEEGGGEEEVGEDDSDDGDEEE